MTSAFYAYPSHPAHIAETVEEALSTINQTKRVKVISWASLRNTGKIIIREILREISKADIFMCDLTGLNPNVMFELGYAIASGKRVWVSLDTSNSSNLNLIKRLPIISQIGYCPYVNHDDIVRQFFNDKPFEDTSPLHEEYHPLVNKLHGCSEETDIFYMKSTLEHTASKKLTQFLQNLNRSLVVDDILESGYQSISWYISNISRARIMLVHLLGNEHNDQKVANAKYSLYAGMAVSLRKPILMVVPAPYDVPHDYGDILVTYNTAKELVEKTQMWVYPHLSRGPRQVSPPVRKDKDPQLTMLEIRLGQSIAEYEENELASYFVETGQYRAGLETNVGLFVGRKGTGKTANLIKISGHFQADNRAVVIVFKPLSFRLETYVKLIERFFTDRDHQGEFTHKIWKLVIYSLMAYQLYLKIQEKKPQYLLNPSEQELVQYVESNRELVTADFGDQMEYLWNLADQSSDQSPKALLGSLFANNLSVLAGLISNALQPYQRVVLLFDNLDKAWLVGRDYAAQQNIIYGLLAFQQSVKNDLQWRKGDIRLLAFLREDIFDVILTGAAEPDKILLNTFRIRWDDPELLLRVIEERFISNDPGLNGDRVWSKYFTTMVDGFPTREYLVSHILPRPRDLVHLTSNAIDECINHNHNIIEESDVKRAQRTYFEFLLENTSVEYANVCPQIREVILAFSGTNRRQTYRTVFLRVKRVVSTASVDEVIKLLVCMSFLGIDVCGREEYAFSSIEADVIMTRLKESRRRSILGGGHYLVIHPAFTTGLGLRGSPNLASI